jgi:hypothetical protein
MNNWPVNALDTLAVELSLRLESINKQLIKSAETEVRVDKMLVSFNK